MTMTTSSPAGGIGRVLTRAVGAVAAGVFALAGLLLMLGALLVGAAAAGGLLLWARLRGRTPAPVTFGWRHTQWQRRGAAGTADGRRGDASDVVDVEVTEVREIRQQREP
jgi:hypothetical protein